MKLISMTDFVLEQFEDVKNTFKSTKINKTHLTLTRITNYAKFLKQPLKLEMFVPCDENGNVLKLPDVCICADTCSLCKKYQKAKEKVLFEFDGGITILRNEHNFFIIEDKNGVYFRILKNNSKSNVESIFNFSVEIKLTERAIKQIGL